MAEILVLGHKPVALIAASRAARGVVRFSLRGKVVDEIVVSVHEKRVVLHRLSQERLRLA